MALMKQVLDRKLDAVSKFVRNSQPEGEVMANRDLLLVFVFTV